MTSATLNGEAAEVRFDANERELGTRAVHKPFGWPLWRKPVLYDSATAECLASVLWEVSHHRDHYGVRRYVLQSQCLYRCPSGRFFLVIRQTDRAPRLCPLWAWQARLWLYRNPPARTVFTSLGICGRYLADG